MAIEAARAKATVGEISDAMEKVFGRYTGQIRTIRHSANMATPPAGSLSWPTAASARITAMTEEAYAQQYGASSVVVWKPLILLTRMAG